MTSEEYLELRVEDQIAWYDRKSQTSQSRFKLFRAAELIAAGSIPMFAGFGSGETWSVITVGVLGAFVAILASLLSLFRYQEIWIEYRSTSESLKHEKYLYLTGVEPYNNNDTFRLFVQRIENLISKENSNWSQSTKVTSNPQDSEG